MLNNILHNNIYFSRYFFQYVVFSLASTPASKPLPENLVVVVPEMRSLVARPLWGIFAEGYDELAIVGTPKRDLILLACR